MDAKQATDASTSKVASQPILPVIYTTHGGGPLPLLGKDPTLVAYWEDLSKRVIAKYKPRVLLLVSAHWEERVPTVQTCEKPAIIYDYYGFPPESYEYSYPAKGELDVSNRVVGLLQKAGFKTATDPKRGFDHGVFVPLIKIAPKADIPVVQLSLLSSLDAAEHIKLGQALSPLRKEGVLIIGSGSSYHNMRGFFGQVPTAAADSEAFDNWMLRTVQDVGGRNAALVNWKKAPSAIAVHPREEHLIPLHVCVGAAGESPGKRTYTNVGSHGIRMSSFEFE